MIKAGIVGLGWWGRTMVQAVEGSSAIKIVKGATRTLSKAEDFAREKGFPLVASYEELLADPDVDAVIFATPHSQHEGQVIAAAAAGKPVFVEKPFTLDKAAAERTIAAVKKAGIVLGLGHNRRFHPSMAMLREKVTSGAIGTILHVESAMTAPAGLAIQPDNWRANAAEAPAGAMTGIGIHLIDSTQDIAGPIEDVTCLSVRRAVKLETEDTTSAVMKLKSGATATFMCSIVSAMHYHFRVYGTGGVATVSTPTFDRFEWVPNGEGEREDKGTPGFNTVTAELGAFAKAVEGGASYPITHEQMIHGVAVLEAAVKSAKTGQSEKVA